MPGRTTAGKRYAQAVAGLAQASNSWEQWRRDLHVIGDLLKQPQVRLTLENPQVPFQRKEQLLDSALGGQFSPMTSNFLKVMGRRGRFDLLSDVIVWFDELADRALGVRRYTITTATPLAEDHRQVLQRHLGADGEAVLTERVDPEILGGIVIRHEDVIRDYSVRARLQTLRDRLN